jgi:hypothetical protein
VSFLCIFSTPKILFFAVREIFNLPKPFLRALFGKGLRQAFSFFAEYDEFISAN